MATLSEFQLNLIKFIEAHGNTARAEGDAVVIETQCVNRNGAVYVEEERVSTFNAARKVLGY